jgi:hypothetical protein
MFSTAAVPVAHCIFALAAVFGVCSREGRRPHHEASRLWKESGMPVVGQGREQNDGSSYDIR